MLEQGVTGMKHVRGIFVILHVHDVHVLILGGGVTDLVLNLVLKC